MLLSGWARQKRSLCKDFRWVNEPFPQPPSLKGEPQPRMELT